MLHIIDRLGKRSGEYVAPLVLVFMGILLVEVVARYAFNSPTKWAHEVSTNIFGAQFMLGGAYCFWRGSMVNVGILHDRLPIRARAILDLFMFLIPLGILGIMLWQGGVFFVTSVKQLEHSITVFGPPLYPIRGVIPLAALLLLVQVVRKFVVDLHLASTGEDLK